MAKSAVQDQTARMCTLLRERQDKAKLFILNENNLDSTNFKASADEKLKYSLNDNTYL